RIVELVDEGVLEPESLSLQRARLALRLQRDLGVNVAGTALVIELLERIASLERRLQRGG
ncbi:MerR family transcriptional regulator, partial [bacterium]